MPDLYDKSVPGAAYCRAGNEQHAATEIRTKGLRFLTHVLAWMSLVWLGCGGGVQSVSLVKGSSELREDFLVKVVDAAPPGSVPVSLSELSLRPRGPMAKNPRASEVKAMRRFAAAHGATTLVIEAVDTPWRRAFYGEGVRPARADEEPPVIGTCVHEEALAERRYVGRRIGRCLKELRRGRRALKGQVKVLFEVDTFGKVRRAAVAPGSSRDGAVRRCGLEAVYRAEFGEHSAKGCRLEVEATL